MSAARPPWKTKKWTAYLIAEATWKVVLFYLIFRLMDVVEASMDGDKVADPKILLSALTVMLAMVIVAGFMEAVAIGGQAVLDKYVRVAQITTGAGAGDEEPPADGDVA